MQGRAGAASDHRSKRPALLHTATDTRPAGEAEGRTAPRDGEVPRVHGAAARRPDLARPLPEQGEARRRAPGGARRNRGDPQDLAGAPRATAPRTAAPS